MQRKLFGLLALGAAAAAAHPMGNFSVNHYARIEPGAHGANIRYVLDLAEIPTFELFQQWGAARDKAMDQARQWAAKAAEHAKAAKSKRLIDERFKGFEKQQPVRDEGLDLQAQNPL